MNNNGFDDINPERSAIKDPEANRHDRMKLFARKLLFYMGIPSRNIHEEMAFEFEGKRYRVDIVGYPEKYPDKDNPLSIAIECGDNKAEKIAVLRSKFSLVLILPYKEFDILEQPEIKLIQKIMRDLEQQTVSNQHYLERIQKFQHEFDKIEDKLNKRMEQAVDQLTTRALEEFRERLEGIDETIKEYEKDLKYLKNFKEFCVKMAADN